MKGWEQLKNNQFKKVVVCVCCLALMIVSACGRRENEAIPFDDNKSTSIDAEKMDNESTQQTKKADENELVEIVTPAILYQDTDVTDEYCQERVKAGGFNSYRINDDGSVTYTMTRAKLDEVLTNYFLAVDDSIAELIGPGSGFPSYKRIEYTDDLRHFSVYVDSEQFRLADQFGVLAFYMLGGMYQSFQSVPSEDIDVVVDYIDIDTEQVLSTASFKDALKGNTKSENQKLTNLLGISTENKYPASMYKVGSDIPNGEYVLICDNSWGAYFEITKDSSGTFEAILANDSFSTNSIVTISDGQYLNLRDCYAIPLIDSIGMDTSQQGMFAVGVHIAAGEYKLGIDESAAAGMGYWEVSSASDHQFTSIVANGTIENEAYITVSDGQYLKLSGCSIIGEPRIDYYIDPTMDLFKFSKYVLHDDVEGTMMGASTLISSIGIVNEATSKDPSEMERLYNEMVSDLEKYVAEKECKYWDLWNYTETLYKYYSTGKLHVIVADAEYIDSIQALLGKDEALLGKFS